MFNPKHSEVIAQPHKRNRHTFFEPVEAEHMYFAAFNSTGFRLTALGAYYRELIAKGRF